MKYSNSGIAPDSSEKLSVEKMAKRDRSPLAIPFGEVWRLKTAFVSRGATTFDIFWRGVPPVENDPGESRNSGRRIEPSTAFPIAKHRHDSARGFCRLEIASSDFGSGLVLNDVSISMLSFLL